jgi:hypothetical protein
LSITADVLLSVLVGGESPKFGRKMRFVKEDVTQTRGTNADELHKLAWIAELPSSNPVIDYSTVEESGR